MTDLQWQLEPHPFRMITDEEVMRLMMNQGYSRNYAIQYLKEYWREYSNELRSGR